MNISSSVSSLASSIFSKLDTKSQGYIEKADLQSAFANLDSASSSSDTDAFFSKIDGDQDGKITESELTAGINNLVEQLNSQLNSARSGQEMPPPPAPGGMPPPGGGNDEGFTKDELTDIASTTDDTKLSGLMTSVAANFEAADTNEDGKVSSQEAMAYQRKAESGSSGSSTSKISANTSSESSPEPSIDQQAASALMKIAQLIQAYGLSDSSTASAVSVSA
jgi:Ca2+-binding EF-hand superfamily protein